MVATIIIAGLLALLADVLCILSIYRMAGYMSIKWDEGYRTRKRYWMALTLMVIVLFLGPVSDYTSHLTDFFRTWMITTGEYSCPISYLASYSVYHTAYGFAISVTCLSMLLWMGIFRRFHAPRYLRLWHAFRVALFSLLLNSAILLLCPSEDYFKEAWIQYQAQSIQ